MIISVLIAGIIALFSALSVAELTVYISRKKAVPTYMPETDFTVCGIYRRLDLDFFQYLCRGCSIAGICPLFCDPVSGIPVKDFAVIICLIFIIINYIGLKESTVLNNILVTLKVLILLFFVAFGLGFFNGSHVTPFAPAGISGILSGAALIFFAYTGFARSRSWPKK